MSVTSRVTGRDVSLSERGAWWLLGRSLPSHVALPRKISAGH